MNLDRIIAVRTNKTVYRDGEYCVKVFDDDFSKVDVLNEALNQARVEETGLNVPKIIEVTKIDGKWAIVSDYIKGKTLSQLMSEEPDKKDEYLGRFVDLQLEMHSKTCPQLFKLKDKMNRKISQTDLSATVRYDLYTRLNSMPKHDKLCHGPICTYRIIVDCVLVFLTVTNYTRDDHSIAKDNVNILPYLVSVIFTECYTVSTIYCTYSIYFCVCICL